MPASSDSQEALLERLAELTTSAARMLTELNQAEQVLRAGARSRDSTKTATPTSDEGNVEPATQLGTVASNLVARIRRLRESRPNVPRAERGNVAVAIARLQLTISEFESDHRTLLRQHEQELANSDEWERRAMLAVRSEDDVLAREALFRRNHHAAIATRLKADAALLIVVLDELRPLLLQLGVPDGARR